MVSKRLGRGLEALIPALEVAEDDHITHIALDEIRPNPYQPRKYFKEEAIEELKKSILEHGVIQPIIVRESIRGFEIIAGERRYRASKAAKLDTIPAVIRKLSEAEVMQIALIENVQREDLNAIEIAAAYQGLMEKFNLTQEELSLKVGKSRPHVTNFLRLLQLPQNIQEYVSRGTLSMGHARALLAVKDKKTLQSLATQCVEQQLSVRHLETLIKEMETRVARATKKTSKKTGADVFVKEAEQVLRDHLGTEVKIKKGTDQGLIEIKFVSDQDLNRIIDIIHQK